MWRRFWGGGGGGGTGGGISTPEDLDPPALGFVNIGNDPPQTSTSSTASHQAANFNNPDSQPNNKNNHYPDYEADNNYNNNNNNNNNNDNDNSNLNDTTQRTGAGGRRRQQQQQQQQLSSHSHSNRTYSLDEFLLHFYLYSFTTRYNDWAFENREAPLHVHQPPPPSNLPPPSSLASASASALASSTSSAAATSSSNFRRQKNSNYSNSSVGYEGTDSRFSNYNSHSYNSSNNGGGSNFDDGSTMMKYGGDYDDDFGSFQNTVLSTASLSNNTLESSIIAPPPSSVPMTTHTDFVDKQVHAMAAQMAPDLYSEIDAAFARGSVPPQFASNRVALAKFLTQSKPHLTLSPEQKTRAIFSWIAHNIDYNVQAYLSGSFSDAARHPDQVLSVRSAICEGYSRLFQALIQAADVVAPNEVVTVAGQARMLGGIRQGKLESHAWNAIILNGQWRLIDVTWAAGHLDGGQFIKRFSDGGHWFADPTEFSHSHLPDDPKWQLLPNGRTVTRQLMERLPLVSHMFFASNVQLLSHNSCTISHSSRSGEPLEIKISVPREDLYLMAQLRLLTPQGIQILEDRTLVQQQAGSSTQWTIQVAFPPGSSSMGYSIQIMGQTRTADSNPDNQSIGAVSMYHSFLEYLCPRPTSCNYVFPHQLDDFLKRPGTALFTPTMGTLKCKTQNQLFIVRVPDAVQVGVCRMNGNTNSWTFLTPGQDSTFEGTVNVSVPCEYFVGARFSKSRKNDNMYRLLLRFMAQ